jgi:hypothetical protein
VRQPVGDKGLWGPVEVQPIMVKALRGHKMDFQSPGGIGTGLEGPEGVELQEQEAQGARPPEAGVLGKGLGGRDPGLL